MCYHCSGLCEWKSRGIHTINARNKSHKHQNLRIILAPLWGYEEWFLEWKNQKHYKMTTSPAGQRTWLPLLVAGTGERNLRSYNEGPFMDWPTGTSRWYSHPSTVNPCRAIPRSFRLHCVGASSLQTGRYRWFKRSDCIKNASLSLPPDT